MTTCTIPSIQNAETIPMPPVCERPKKPLLFMELPAEIHIMIIHEALKLVRCIQIISSVYEAHIQVHYDRDEFEVFKGASEVFDCNSEVVESSSKNYFDCTKRRPLPSWMLTRKLFLEEGLRLLLGNSVWQFQFICNMPKNYSPENNLLDLSLAQHVVSTPIVGQAVWGGGLHFQPGPLLRLSRHIRADDCFRTWRMEIEIPDSGFNGIKAFAWLTELLVTLNYCRRLRTLHIMVYWYSDRLRRTRRVRQIGWFFYDLCKTGLQSLLQMDLVRETEDIIEKKRASGDHYETTIRQMVFTKG